jgi:DNA-directed RNA polymerase specialized sigma24 family protein
MPQQLSAADIERLEKNHPELREKAMVAREVVATLPDYQADVFRRYWLPYFGPGQGYTEEEIARDMGMSTHQVHSLILQTFEAIGKEWRRRKGITTGRLTPR